MRFFPPRSRQIVSKTELKVERRGHTATQLSDGKILIVGGENVNGPVSASEIFDPAAGTVADGAFLITARTEHSASPLADGSVLIAGGRGDSGPLDSTEIFNAANAQFSSGPTLTHARAGHTATALKDGRILIAGGEAGGSAELFRRCAPSLWFPAIWRPHVRLTRPPCFRTERSCSSAASLPAGLQSLRPNSSIPSR